MMKFSYLALMVTLGINSSLVFAQVEQPKEASSFTKAANEAVLKDLPFNDKQDFEDAKKGFVATLDPMTIKDEKGNVSWDLTTYGFIKGEPRQQ